MRRERYLTVAIYSLTTLIGLAAFFYPFFIPLLGPGDAATPLFSAPAMLAILVVLSLAVLLIEGQGQRMGAKQVALLALLVAINSILRFLDNAFPLIFEFSPIFFLIVCTGYIFGGRFGLLLGTLTLLVSALITGGVGPWLPYQMIVAGWVGLSAPLLRGPLRLLRLPAGGRGEIALLTVFAIGWGFAYGAIMNLWSWPFLTGDPTMFWELGLPLAETLKRYATFYAATSFAADLSRAVGNGAMVILLGQATLRALRRFHQRFDFAVQPLLQPVS